MKKTLQDLYKQNAVLSKEIDIVHSIMQKISMNMDFLELTRHIIDTLDDSIQFDICDLGIVVDDKYLYFSDYFMRNVPKDQPGLVDYFKKMISGKINYHESNMWACIALRENREIYYPKLELEKFDDASQKFINMTGIGSVYILPVTIQEKKLGVVIFNNFRREKYLEEFEKDLIRKRIALIAHVIENYQIHNKIKVQKQQLDHDISIARTIQQNFLPQNLPHCHRVEIASAYVPMAEVGGDYYDFFIPDSANCAEFGVIISDVSGHGVPAAFITSMVKMAFNSGALAGMCKSPAVVLKTINDGIIDKTVGNFVTSQYAYFDFRNMTMKSASAGHNPLLLVNRETGAVTEVTSRGKFLGIYRDMVLEEKETPLQPGTRIILYTDGLIESINQDEVEFYDRFMQLLSTSGKLSAGEFKNLLLKELSAHALYQGKDYFDDDVAFIVIDVLN